MANEIITVFPDGHTVVDAAARIGAAYVYQSKAPMADKVKRKDSSVRDIVRALVDGVITPRHAVVKLEKLVHEAYQVGRLREAVEPYVNEESL